MKMSKGGAAGATKIGAMKKPGKQGKVGGISTPFSNRIMKGMKGLGGKR